MDVRAPALVHTRGYGLAHSGNAVSWRRGRGWTFALAAPARWVHIAHAGAVVTGLRLGRNAVSFFILTLLT